MKNKFNLITMSEDIWIVVPAYEEEAMVASVIRGLREEGYDKIIVVDDGSTDDTADIAESKGVEVIRHAENFGLGASLRTGLRAALDRGADVAITFDADGQHDPKEIDRMVSLIEDGADFVVGARNRYQMPLNKRLGNSVLNVFTRFFGGILTDSQSGFRAFSQEALEEIEIWSDGYSVSSEIVMQAGWRGLESREVGIEGIFTEYSKSGGTNIADGVRIIFNLFCVMVLHSLHG